MSEQSSSIGSKTHKPVGQLSKAVEYLDAASGISIVASARLNDAGNLASLLGCDASDTGRLILQAYLKWGEACLQRITGDFAFVIRSREGVFCARDHLGLKPFCYAVKDDQFHFGSDARTVAKATGAAVSHRRIADSLVFPLEHVDKTSTFYEGITRLPPGSWLKFSHGRLVVRQYWQVGDVEPVRGMPRDEAIEQFSSLLAKSVADNQSPAITGVSLSGGVDSTLVISLADPSSVQAFSLVSSASDDCAETRHIDAFLSGNAGIVYSQLQPGEIDRFSPQLLEHLSDLSEPFDYYMISYMLVCQMASEAGINAVMDGVEGDMMFSFPPTYPSTLIRGGRIIPGLREAISVYRRMAESSPSLAGHLFHVLRQVGLPPGMRRLKGRFNRSRTADRDEQLIDPSFAREQHVDERLEALNDELYGGYPDLAEQHRRNVHHPAIAAALERYMRVASWHGIEARHPLLNKDLVDFAYSLPWHFLVHDGWSKFLLRSAGVGRVPDSVRWQVGKHENAWRFINQFTALCGKQMKTVIQDERQLLAPFIRDDVLNDPAGDDLMQLYGLLCWLKHEVAT